MSLQEILLSPWIIFTVFFVVFLGVSRWALIKQQEYAGYGLGLMLALLLMIIYGSLGGGQVQPLGDPPTTLNFLQVIFPAFLGLLLGGTIMIVVQFGKKQSTNKGLQVTFLTALNAIMMILLLIQGPIARRMIGIFALAFGIAALSTQVLFRDVNDPDADKADAPPNNNQGGQGQQPANGQAPFNPTQNTANRFDQIRNTNDPNRR